MNCLLKVQAIQVVVLDEISHCLDKCSAVLRSGDRRAEILTSCPSADGNGGRDVLCRKYYKYIIESKPIFITHVRMSCFYKVFENIRVGDVDKANIGRGQTVLGVSEINFRQGYEIDLRKAVCDGSILATPAT